MSSTLVVVGDGSKGQLSDIIEKLTFRHAQEKNGHPCPNRGYRLEAIHSAAAQHTNASLPQLFFKY